MTTLRTLSGRPAKAPRAGLDGNGKGGLRGLGLWWTFAGALVIVAAVIVAVAQNSRQVRLHYLAWHVNVSLIVVLLTTALGAVLLDEAGGLIWRRRRRSRDGKRNELEQLRTLHAQPGETHVTVDQLSLHTGVVASAEHPVRLEVPNQSSVRHRD